MCFTLPAHETCCQSLQQVLQSWHSFFPLKFDKLSHMHRAKKARIQKVIAATVHYWVCARDGNDEAGNFHCSTHNSVPHLQETTAAGTVAPNIVHISMCSCCLVRILHRQTSTAKRRCCCGTGWLTWGEWVVTFMRHNYSYICMQNGSSARKLVILCVFCKKPLYWLFIILRDPHMREQLIRDR